MTSTDTTTHIDTYTTSRHDTLCPVCGTQYHPDTWTTTTPDAGDFSGGNLHHHCPRTTTTWYLLTDSCPGTIVEHF